MNEQKMRCPEETRLYWNIEAVLAFRLERHIEFVTKIIPTIAQQT